MNRTAVPDTNKWTMMFFFAGDNMLSPSMISQLKAIKDAGYQKNTTVLVRFDPNEAGAPTRIFNVHQKNKKGRRKTRIGDGPDSFVHNLREDEVKAEHVKSSGIASIKVREQIEAPWASDILNAYDALDSFLGYCYENHPAEHYMLFLVGHGMIVGSDAFLPDDRPDTAISLKQLGTILGNFARNVKGSGALELVGLHSCSMSAVEVAYELRGKANYMLATEGTSFVGSWPYRQLLKKIFNTVEKSSARKPFDVTALLDPLIRCCLHNSTDFMFAGFSADLCMCSLNDAKVRGVNEPMRELVKNLRAGLKDARVKELILLSHWEAQSYWQENYIDLYDFCHCLGRRCEADVKAKPKTRRPRKEFELQEAITAACKEMKKALDRLVIFSDYFGPTYQYSHGLSVYFPWSRPIDEGDPARDKGKKRYRFREKEGGEVEKLESIMEKYEKYDFTTVVRGDVSELGGDYSWFAFLTDYFELTRRGSREAEEGISGEREKLFVSNPAANRAPGETLPGGDKTNPRLTGGKTSPADSGGGSCGCGSIKNYPQGFSLSERAEQFIHGRKPGKRKGAQKGRGNSPRRTR